MSMFEILLREYGYLSLVLVLLLDGSGIPMPTEATLVVAGAAVRAGHLRASLVLSAALTGATLGSTFSYYLGRRHGKGIMGRLVGLMRLSPSHLWRLEDWFSKYGDRAVFLARFIPFVRCLTGYPAGVMRMHFGRYLLLSLAGYTGYVLFALGLGYGGLAVARIIGDIDLILWAAIPLVVLIAWLKWGRTWRRKLRGKG